VDSIGGGLEPSAGRKYSNDFAPIEECRKRKSKNEFLKGEKKEGDKQSNAEDQRRRGGLLTVSQQRPGSE